MQSQDTYNRDFDANIAVLDRWLDTLTMVAAVDRESAGAYWRARITPHEANSCPVELMLSRDQTYDIEVGPESLVHQPVAGFGIFLQLLQAIADGRVVRRSWSALATGCALTQEIIVRPPDGHDWSIRRVVNAGSAISEQTATARDHVYVPYRRG